MTGAHRKRHSRYHVLPWWEGLVYVGRHRGVYDWMIGSRIERRDVNFSINIQPYVEQFDAELKRQMTMLQYQMDTALPPWVWR